MGVSADVTIWVLPQIWRFSSLRIRRWVLFLFFGAERKMCSRGLEEALEIHTFWWNPPEPYSSFQGPRDLFVLGHIFPFIFFGSFIPSFWGFSSILYCRFSVLLPCYPSGSGIARGLSLERGLPTSNRSSKYAEEHIFVTCCARGREEVRWYRHIFTPARKEASHLLNSVILLVIIR